MRVAVIGFGYSGALTAANLVRAATAPLALYLIDEQLDARGVAYGTGNPDHLLNVRAYGMSAFADAPEDLVRWLQSDAGKAAAAVLKLRTEWQSDDFIPRMLYGAYLADIWEQTQHIAAEKEIQLKLVPSRAVALKEGDAIAVLTERGDAIAVDKAVLAVGHEMRPLTRMGEAAMVQNPWAKDAFTDAASWPSPVMLVGTGLTAIDVVLSLRRAGYQSEIIACSRRGSLPKVHALPTSIFSFAEAEIAAQKNLAQMMRLVRKNLDIHDDWRVVIDALRPHTQFLWQRLTTREQQRFLRFVMPVWNVHRHRMAPEIAAAMEAEMAAGTLRIAPLKNDAAPSHVINCTGLELNLARSGNALLRQLLAEGAVEAHANALGIAADPSLRAWGKLHPRLYVIGSLLTGQLLESTAVPELRAQAASIAKAILS